MKKIYALLLLVSAWGYAPLLAQYPNSDLGEYDGYEYSDERIQIALLLDVSGSMEGLLEQAKSQLWYIVNGIMYDYGYSRPPRLELALYEYGSRYPGENGRYLRQVVPFTRDLDWLSSELFRLEVDGRREYCGSVLESALRNLNWSYGPADRRMIYIAGNESFGQGPVSARRALDDAYRRGITVHTIYCGDGYRGRQEGWEEAAYYGGGDFLTIDHNAHDYYRGDPYDQRLLGLNQRLNQTYLPYGSQATICFQRQQRADQRAQRYGVGIASQRVIAKASPAYLQPQWDLIDAVSTGQVNLASLSQDELPPEMRGMSLSEQRTFLRRKAQERQQVRQEIHQLATEQKQKAPATGPLSAGQGKTLSTPGRSGSAPATLGDAIIQSTQKPSGDRSGVRSAPKRPPQREFSRPAPEAPATPSPRPSPRETQPTRRSTPPPTVQPQVRTPQPSRSPAVRRTPTKSVPMVNPSRRTPSRSTATPEVKSTPRRQVTPAPSPTRSHRSTPEMKPRSPRPKPSVSRPSRSPAKATPARRPAGKPNLRKNN
jgi:hypothetical protein